MAYESFFMPVTIAKYTQLVLLSTFRFNRLAQYLQHVQDIFFFYFNAKEKTAEDVNSHNITAKNSKITMTNG